MKKIWKKLSSRIWLIVTAVVLVIVIVVNILASGQFFNLLCIVLNSPARMEVLEGQEDARFSNIEGADTRKTAAEYGHKITEEICEEGFTLLKNENNGLPLKAGAKVSVFGKNSVNMAMGGSGSGGASFKDAKNIFDSLTAAGFEYNKALVDFYNSPASGEGRPENSDDLDSGDVIANISTGETPWAAYGDVINSCNEYKDAAIIVITRIGGEGFDMPRSYLKLDQNERDLIDHVGEMGFGSVIVLLNISNAVELQDLKADPDVDSILWTGYTGDSGMMALGRILSGEVTPSGKTVFTYATLESNPTWNNFGGEIGSSTDPNYSGDAYLRIVKGEYHTYDPGVYFVDEEEDIYVGYRYYETAYAEHEEGNYPQFDYDAVVSYPFGYGLSYTTFSWEVDDSSSLPSTLEEDTSITLRVNVTNTGNKAGRDVVQLYVTPPHTHGGIEKSAKVLVGFAKTDVLDPGETDTVTITIDSPYAFASYDCYAKSGKAGYITEKGEYIFTISTDAHSAKNMKGATFTATAENDIRYFEDTVKNLFTGNEDESLNMDTELSVQLSRADFNGTWPTSRTIEERMLDKADYEALNNTPENNPNEYTEMPETGVKQGIMLGQLIGAEYNSPLWDEYLNQFEIDQMVKLVNEGAFTTQAIPEYGVPLTRSSDGPVGWVNFVPGISETFVGCCKYCCEEVISSTWNLDRMYDMGVAVGNEGLVGDKANGLTFSGWYAPGLNIHRSPMGGRNFEYYSEDPFLSGQATASVMKGLAQKGVYVNLKHFAMNEQETHRSANGVLTWGTEQALREIYLKGFEIAIKTAQNDYTVLGNGERVEGGKVVSMGVMSSFNRIGTIWTGGDYRLITNILRGEWGFEGLVICDFNTCSHMNVRNMIYAGGDLNLEMAGTHVWTDPDHSNAGDVTVLRQATKNILFTIVNSNAYRGEFVIHMPIWQIIMIVVDVVIVVGLAVWGFFAVRGALKAGKTEDKKSD